MENTLKKAQSALISVFCKDGLAPLVRTLDAMGIAIYATGGTEKFIREQGIEVTPIERLTTYPSILGGRVKTLHPQVFGGILSRRTDKNDTLELAQYNIPLLDIVVVDLYPFEKTLASGSHEADIIEKIDIGGISLIRAAAKNYRDVMTVPSRESYSEFIKIITAHDGTTSLKDRKRFAAKAFNISSHYDTAVFNYFNSQHKEETVFKQSILKTHPLRYGENPHQKGYFFGDLHAFFDKIHGKELSYNNLLDINAAINLINEFKEEAPTFAILKHNNACGIATRDKLPEAFTDALAGDPVSAFGGVLISNTTLDTTTAEKIDKLFCEVVIAPEYQDEAIAVLKRKKNRILLIQKMTTLPKTQFQTALNGVLVQDRDFKTDHIEHMKTVTKRAPSPSQFEDMVFASKICKHTKSNAIVLTKNKQLLASGTGQTSRVDALKQAVRKAKKFDFDLKNAVMASDAFFPFPDCVEIALNAGIHAVIQPGGSIKDQLSIDFCDSNKMVMVFTATRHFKH